MITNFKLFEQAQEDKDKDKDWKLALDISKIWKESIYENPNEVLKFNEQYINFLTQQKDLIIQNTSEDAWNKLQELITRLTENKDKLEESMTVWDDIYDWADGNMVQIKVQQEELEKDF